MTNEKVTEREYRDYAADKVDKLASQGHLIPVDPDVADHMGAFHEEALSEEDALESRFDDVINNEGEAGHE